MVFEFLPMHYGSMSCYTVCAFAVLTSAGLLAFNLIHRWASSENRRIEKYEADDVKRLEGEIQKLETAIGGHDEYIDDTTGVINQIHIDLAVQENSMIDLKQDIAEIKADIKTLLKR